VVLAAPSGVVGLWQDLRSRLERGRET